MDPKVKYKHLGHAEDLFQSWKDQIVQHQLDRVAPYHRQRWIGTAVLAFMYVMRVFSLHGWYIVTYVLGIYLLNLLIGFISPKVDPATEDNILPLKQDDEFRPFIRRLPEFKFWYECTRAFAIALFCTFFSIFDIPVFWPILLMYFIVLFTLTMKQQIKHMIKYKYVPFDFGKTAYKKMKGEEDHPAANVGKAKN